MPNRKLPPWIRIRLKTGGQAGLVRAALAQAGLPTVCESAQCPNRPECFQRGTATVMILGNICTRRCPFCAVAAPTTPAGVPHPPQENEPQRVSRLVGKLKLRHAVITSVTRDDLPDGGAGVFAATVTAIRALRKDQTTIEVLTPDFAGSEAALATVLGAQPDVFNHNLETVQRLQPAVRPQADYGRSLAVLKFAAKSGQARMVKSGLMVGLGETDRELLAAMRALLAAGCRSLTIGQYLAPSRRHLPVCRFVPPAQFQAYRRQALALGFKAVAAGPLARSSYRADLFFENGHD